MKNEENDNINDGFLEMMPGIPVEAEYKEPWRKACYSCSGGGRIPGRFDLRQMKTIYDGLVRK